MMKLGKHEIEYHSMGIQVKDGTVAQLSFNYDTDKVNGKTYYTDEEIINVNFDDKTFTVSVSPLKKYVADYREVINYPVGDYMSYFKIMSNKSIPLMEKLHTTFVGVLLVSSINMKFTTEDNKDYLVLEEYGTKAYFDRETLLPVKVVMEGYALSNYEEYVNEYFIFENGNLKNEDVTIPDLSEYSQVVNDL